MINDLMNYEFKYENDRNGAKIRYYLLPRDKSYSF